MLIRTRSSSRPFCTYYLPTCEGAVTASSTGLATDSVVNQADNRSSLVNPDQIGTHKNGIDNVRYDDTDPTKKRVRILAAAQMHLMPWSKSNLNI